MMTLTDSLAQARDLWHPGIAIQATIHHVLTDVLGSHEHTASTWYLSDLDAWDCTRLPDESLTILGVSNITIHELPDEFEDLSISTDVDIKNSPDGRNIEACTTKDQK